MHAPHCMQSSSSISYTVPWSVIALVGGVLLYLDDGNLRPLEEIEADPTGIFWG